MASLTAKLSNLANLLPTGTVLAFEALIPSFTRNGGSCLPAHKFFTISAVVIFSIVCVLSTFTDSFTAKNGKLYFGIATFKGLYIFKKRELLLENDHYNNNIANKDQREDVEERGDQHHHQKKLETTISTANDHSHDTTDLGKYSIRFIDFVHAFFTLLVFLAYATSSSDVERCLFPQVNENEKAWLMNLPLAVGTIVSLLFMFFPTTRRGIGYADVASAPKK